MTTANADPGTLNAPSLTARHVMTAEPICVTASTRIAHLSRTFDEHNISGAPVVDSQGRLVAMISRRNLPPHGGPELSRLRRSYRVDVASDSARGVEVCDFIPESLLCVDDLMDHDPLTVPPDLSVSRLARLMFQRRAHRAVVTSSHRIPIGIITVLDLLGAFGSIPRSAPGTA